MCSEQTAKEQGKERKQGNNLGAVVIISVRDVGGLDQGVVVTW